MKKVLLTLAALAGTLCLYAQNADEPVYADSSTNLEKYMVPATGDFATPDKDGFLGRWLLLEPISKPQAQSQQHRLHRQLHPRGVRRPVFQGPTR